MDKMLKEIAKMDNDAQVRVFAELENKLGVEIADELRKRVFFIKLQSDKEFYNNAVRALANGIYNKVNNL